MKTKTKTKTKASVKVSGSKSGNPRLASEFAIGIIFFVAVIIGGIFWYIGIGNKQASELSKNQPTTINEQKEAIQAGAEKASENLAVASNECKPHYYEGEKEIEGWLVSQGDDGIMLAVKKEELAKLPTENSKLMAKGEDYTFKLIDLTEEVKNKIKDSSRENPAKLTVRGYAEICQQPPLLSIQPAAVAFKKQS
jgi:hypothetical protein